MIRLVFILALTTVSAGAYAWIAQAPSGSPPAGVSCESNITGSTGANVESNITGSAGANVTANMTCT